MEEEKRSSMKAESHNNVGDRARAVTASGWGGSTQARVREEIDYIQSQSSKSKSD